MTKATNKKRTRRQRLQKKRDRYKILTFHAKELWTACDSVQPDDECLWLDDMRIALMQTKNGIGIAAPQIGVMKRAFLIWPDRHRLPLEFINPQYVDLEAETYKSNETCLSFPGFCVGVQRRETVRLQWEAVTGDKLERTFEKAASRIIQHEVGHLDGECCVGLEWRRAAGI